MPKTYFIVAVYVLNYSLSFATNENWLFIPFKCSKLFTQKPFTYKGYKISNILSTDLKTHTEIDYHTLKKKLN